MNEMKNEAETAEVASTNERDSFEAWAKRYDLVSEPNYSEATKADCWAAWKARAALAATQAAAPAMPKWIDDPHDIEQGQMLNPEWVRQQQPAIMPKGESAAAQLRAMATNYPSGHSWDKLDAACIRGALEIEALLALLAQAATATGLPRQPHCSTCNDHGAVGNILMAEPCPDCTVPAIRAQADARDVESDYQRGYRHGYNRRDAEVQGALL